MQTVLQTASYITTLEVSKKPYVAWCKVVFPKHSFIRSLFCPQGPAQDHREFLRHARLAPWARAGNHMGEEAVRK